MIESNSFIIDLYIFNVFYIVKIFINMKYHDI